MEEHLNNHIDKLFRDSLKYYEDVPSGESWKTIEDQLDNEDLIAYRTRKRRRILVILSFLVILAGLGAFILNYQIQHTYFGATVSKSDIKTAEQAKSPVNPHKPNEVAAILSAEKKANMSALSVQNRLPVQTYSPEKDFSIQMDSAIFEFHPVSMKFPDISKYSFPMNVNDQAGKLKPSENTLIRPFDQGFINRISITSYFSKEFAGYNLSDYDSTGSNGREIEQKERNVFSASVGININYRVKKRWVIQSGLSYSWSNSIIDSSKSFAVLGNDGMVKYKFNTISGYGFLQPLSTIQPNVGDSVFTAKAYSQLHYLTFPLIISYGIPLKKFSLLIGTGVSFNFLTNATVETKIYGMNYSQDESAIPMKGLKKINYGIILKAELEYRINSKIGIDLIPCFKNSLTPINIHSAVSAYPYNFGIGAGVSYKF